MENDSKKRSGRVAWIDKGQTRVQLDEPTRGTARFERSPKRLATVSADRYSFLTFTGLGDQCFPVYSLFSASRCFYSACCFWPAAPGPASSR